MKVLVTGATGFLGRHLTKHLISTGRSVVAFARSEHGHETLRAFVGERGPGDGRLDSVIGDVRDFEALLGVLDDDFLWVIHAAAQKCVPWAEKCPEEALKTNAIGSVNVMRAAKMAGARALLVSSDKAAYPACTYGASKYLAECVWKDTVVRLGNIWGSTGSVVYKLLEQRGSGVLRITHAKMRRWHILVEEAVAFIMQAMEQGGREELWIPKMRWYRLEDLAKAVDPQARIKPTGIRRGEKLSEHLLTDEEAPYASDHEAFIKVQRGNVTNGAPIKIGISDPMTVDELRHELGRLPKGNRA